MHYLRIISLAILLLIVTVIATHAQGLFQQFMIAWQKKDYQTCVKTGKMLTARVEHPDLLVQLAACHCGLGEFTEAQAIFQSLALRGLQYHPDSLDELSNDKNYKFSKQWEELLGLTLPSRSLKTIALRDSTLIPEGIAFDVKRMRHLIGSLNTNKIISIDEKGQEKEFFKPNDGSQWSFTGIKIYDQQVWACAFSESGANKGHAAIFRIDLLTGKLLHQISLTTGEHLFNDVVRSQAGELFVTDSKSGHVYLLKNEQFVPIADSATFIYPNGIAIDDQHRKLYVAHWSGIQVIHLDSGQGAALTSANQYFLSSIDGLYMQNNNLIAIQNVHLLNRVIRIMLQHDEVIDVTELCRLADPGIPTTGVLIGNSFHFIRNSLVRYLQPDRTLPSNLTPVPASISVLPLNP